MAYPKVAKWAASMAERKVVLKVDMMVGKMVAQSADAMAERKVVPKVH